MNGVYKYVRKAHSNQELVLINKIIQRFDTQSSKNGDKSGRSCGIMVNSLFEHSKIFIHFIWISNFV